MQPVIKVRTDHAEQQHVDQWLVAQSCPCVTCMWLARRTRPESPAETSAAANPVCECQRPRRLRPTKYPRIPRAPKAWPALSQKLECSPAELAQCVALGAEHMQWLVPGISASQALSTLNAWAPFDQLQMHQSAVCLESVAHLRAEHPYAAGGLHLMFKAEILRGVRNNLSDPVKALSPSTLGVLTALASFEVAQDSPDAQPHLLGIGSILKARGGLDYQGFGGGLRKYLEWIDLLWAVKHARLPLYSGSILVALGPKYEAEKRLAQVRVDSILGAPVSFASPSVAWMWARQIARVLDPTYYEKDDIEAGLYCQDWDKEPLFFLHAESDSGIVWLREPDETSMCALHAAWHKHFERIRKSDICTRNLNVALRQAILLLDEDLQSDYANDLCSHLETIGPSLWDRIPGTHIRILLVAIASSRDPVRKNWLGAELGRRAVQMRVSEWLTIKLVILEFIQLQIYLRQFIPPAPGRPGGKRARRKAYSKV